MARRSRALLLHALANSSLLQRRRKLLQWARQVQHPHNGWDKPVTALKWGIERLRTRAFSAWKLRFSANRALSCAVAHLEWRTRKLAMCAWRAHALQMQQAKDRFLCALIQWQNRELGRAFSTWKTLASDRHRLRDMITLRLANAMNVALLSALSHWSTLVLGFVRVFAEAALHYRR